MKSTRFLILGILGLFSLLILLGSLQYVWLGEISRSQHENLQNHLNKDIKNFAGDFNSELRWAYFSFRIDSKNWLNHDWRVFNERYSAWKAKTSYPTLLKDIYFVSDSALLRYEAESKTFKSIEFDKDLSDIKRTFEENKGNNAIDALVINTYFLLMPIYVSKKENFIEKNSKLKPDNYLLGYAVLKLNEETVRQFLGDLTEKHFPANNSASYQIIVSDNPDLKQIYSNKELLTNEWEKNDSNIALLNLTANPFSLFASDNVTAFNKKIRPNNTQVIVSPPLPKMSKGETSNVIKLYEQNEKTKEILTTGYWNLSVRHEQGSLEQFITNTRRRNLAISFVILFILGASIILIFISAQRAKRLAQRQIDFVSAVSHEFRTPLTVIYSAGENLADGIAKEENQIIRYGNLIKNEGGKLSKMVEQILEFAGANSGRKNYDFQQTNVSEVIEKALFECQSLLDEKAFTVEKSVAENLPKISADKTALSQAIQNLIINAVKYSNDEKYIKISAGNGGGKINIAVEDHGIGIAAKDLKHVFEPFYRAKSVVDEQISGNGLGLNLVRQIVDAHNGKIEAASEIDKGSKFTIILTV